MSGGAYHAGTGHVMPCHAMPCMPCGIPVMAFRTMPHHAMTFKLPAASHLVHVEVHKQNPQNTHVSLHRPCRHSLVVKDAPACLHDGWDEG